MITVDREPHVVKSAYLDNDITHLVAACRTGDQQAWRTLVDQFSPLVWTIARSHRLSSADRDDVYQMTWMRTVQHLDKVRSPDRMAAWITTAARRECLKHIERERRLVPVGESAVLDRPEPGDARPDDLVVRRAYNVEVLAAFRKLPERDQTLLGVLMADPAPSYDQASLTLGLPRGSIGPLRQRALARLRALLPALTK
jgi:RNA polymerase sigma factor (sigma-70 family)